MCICNALLTGRTPNGINLVVRSEQATAAVHGAVHHREGSTQAWLAWCHAHINSIGISSALNKDIPSEPFKTPLRIDQLQTQAKSITVLGWKGSAASCLFCRTAALGSWAGWHSSPAEVWGCPGSLWACAECPLQQLCAFPFPSFCFLACGSRSEDEAQHRWGDHPTLTYTAFLLWPKSFSNSKHFPAFFFCSASP